ncbi:MAG: prolyl oligopeptidase family serine peptidase [Polyangiaceae bacterium]
MRSLTICLLFAALCGCGSADDAASDDSRSDGGATDAASSSDSSSFDGSSAHDGSVTLPDGGSATGFPSTLGGAAVAGSSGCGGAAATGMQTISLTVGAATRTGLYVMPADYDSSKAYPVVFVFHGDGGTGASIRSSLNLETAASGKAIFVYLDGASKTWNDELTADNQDMDFVMAARDLVRSKACVDMSRTFATGHSRGAFFVNQLACKYGVAEFAAMAPHSSTISAASGSDYIYGSPNANGGPYTEGGNFDFRCPVDPTAAGTVPILPPPMFIIHGQCDAESGVTFAEGRNVAEHWGFAAKCSSTPAVIVDANAHMCDGTDNNCPTVASDPCYVAPGCAPGHDITFCAIPNMEHVVWCKAPERIWSFFAAH